MRQWAGLRPRKLRARSLAGVALGLSACAVAEVDRQPRFGPDAGDASVTPEGDAPSDAPDGSTNPDASTSDASVDAGATDSAVDRMVMDAATDAVVDVMRVTLGTPDRAGDARGC